MEYPVCKLDACNYNELSKHTKVYNINCIDQFVWIYLSPDICSHLDIFRIEEIVPSTQADVDGGCVSREGTCWIKLCSSGLSMLPGQHVYKITMLHRHTADLVPLYFSYILQDDNPEKPYVYMNKDATESCTCKCPYSAEIL